MKEFPTCHISISVNDQYTTAATASMGGSLNVIDGLVDSPDGEIDIDDVMLALRAKVQESLDEIRSTLALYVQAKRLANQPQIH